MKTTALANAKPPESYNQDYWLCLKQRNAWLLQRRVEHGEPFISFLDKRAIVFVSDEQELSGLFNTTKKIAVRYVEDCYWIVWEENGYYFVLSLEHYIDENEKFSSPTTDHEHCKTLRMAIQHILVSMYETGSMPKSMTDLYFESNNRMKASCRAIYSGFEKDGYVGFYTCEKTYVVHNSVIINWFTAFKKVSE